MEINILSFYAVSLIESYSTSFSCIHHQNIDNKKNSTKKKKITQNHKNKLKFDKNKY